MVCHSTGIRQCLAGVAEFDDFADLEQTAVAVFVEQTVFDGLLAAAVVDGVGFGLFFVVSDGYQRFVGDGGEFDAVGTERLVDANFAAQGVVEVFGVAGLEGGFGVVE